MTTSDGRTIRPLDVRGFGLFYWYDMSNYPATEYAKALEYLEAELPQEVVEERRGIWRITWAQPANPGVTFNKKLWINRDAGFSPIRMEFYYRPDSIPADARITLLQEDETTWIEIAGVWVPKTYRIVSTHNHPAVESYEFSFDWELVNQPISPETFMLKDLKLRPGYQVVDNSLGREIDVGSIGRDHALVEDGGPVPRVGPAVIAPSRAWQGWSPSLPYLLAGAGLAALGGAGWYRFRPARRGSAA